MHISIENIDFTFPLPIYIRPKNTVEVVKNLLSNKSFNEKITGSGKPQNSTISSVFFSLCSLVTDALHGKTGRSH